MADAYRSRFKFPRGDAVNKTIIGRAPFGNIPSDFRPHPAQSADGFPEELAEETPSIEKTLAASRRAL